MKSIRLIGRCVLVAACMLPMLGTAEDIDIYEGLNGTARTPNVLLILDNGANFDAHANESCTYADGGSAPTLGSTTGGIEQCAIYNTIYSLKPNGDGSAKVNIGLMVFNQNGFSSYGCNDGGNGGCLLNPLV